MKSEKYRVFHGLAQLSSLGISMALAIGIGVYFGLTLDRWFDSAPWFFYIFLFIGIAAGFKNVYIIAKKISKDDNGSA